MDVYETLAEELIGSLDRRRKGPPHEEISAAMRGEMAVLRLLVQERSTMTAGEISRTLGMTTSRIAAVLGSLEKKAMILRRADERDKRRVLVTLTESGSSFCRRRREDAVRDMTALLDHLGEEDAAHFVRIMKRVHEFIPDHPPRIRENMHQQKEESAHEQ
ncbi:MAG: MarR family transcriptional regulator [Clostridiales bacterium]|nr:MarR family transcriptional regulator [Clostridiales bacterium]